MGIKKLLVIPVFALFSAMFGGIGSAYASFSVQTSSVTTNTQIYFTLAATGTFSINCGTGGRLMKGSSYLGSNGATVTVTQNDTNATSYSCKYSSSGIKTITFNGTATAYNADSTVACIRFTQNQDKIATVSGNMASVFPVVTVNNNPISPSFANTFAGCSLKQIPSGLFDFGQNGAPARENMFRGTFQSTTLTPPNNGSPIPADLFYTIQGSKPGMFRATFYNCQSLTFVPDGLFDFDGNTVYGYDYMFYETFSGCTSLTTFPDDLFANVEPDPSAQYVFSKTFYGCTSLTGNHNYIPSEMFGSFIPNDGYASSIMDGTFDNTGTFANSCPNDMEQFITGYESYWGSNKKSCGAPHSVYFHPGDSLNSGNGTVPSGSMSSYDDVPLNSNIELPTPSFNTQYMQGYDFVGWLCKDGAAMNGIYQPGDWITMQNADVSCTAQWAPFHMVTTNLSNNDTFTFTLSAAGEFWVNCGEDGVLSGVGVSGNTITKSDTTNYTYTCTYTSGGKKYLDFNGIATKYDNQGIYDNNTGEYLPVTTIKFTSPSKVSGLDGNLAKIFPPVYQDLNGMNDYGYLYPKFYQTFKDCVNLSSIPTYYDNNDNMYHGTLFSYDESIGDIYGNEHKVADFMFRETFKGCTSLQVIPDDLFPTVVTDGAGAMFKGTFSGCTNLETIPDGLFKFGGDALVPGIPELFRETFSGCTSLETIPDLLFDFGDDGYGNPLYMTVGQEMFSETFAGCTSLEVFPNDLFANFVDPNGNLRYPNNAFYRTFYGCTNLTGKLGYIPPEMFGALVPNPGYDPSTMMDTFADTGTFALTCPSGTTQYITGYESTWGTDKKSCNPAGVIFYAGDSNNDGTGTPATGSMNNINATYGDTVILPANQFQPMNGRFFSDWYCTGENVTIGHMSPGDTFTMPNGSVTCTAQWDVPRVQFRPGYSNNNGTGTPATGSMNDIIAASGTTVTLPANQFTAPNGYVFAEWVCDNNIGNVSPGDTFTQPNAVVICTAQWERTRVVFAPGDTNNNGTGTLATGSMNDIIAASGTTVTLPANQFSAPLNTPYYFVDWLCDNNIGQKSSGDTFTMPSAVVTCTAQWRLSQVMFEPGDSNNNGTGTYATGSMGTMFNEPSDTVTLPANQFTAPNGYVFAEWVCDNNIGNVSPGDTFTQPNAVVICTAQWEKTRVVFAPGDTNNNGTGTPANGSMNDIIAASGTTVTLPANQFTSNVTGYEFNGWVCDNNIGQKSSGDTFTMPSAIVICTAQWTNVFSITYFDDDCNTVLSGLSPTQYEYGLNGAPLLPLPTPSRPGYDFVGWRTNCQGASNTAISELSNTDSGNRVLFATFSVRQIPLSFDGNTVSGSASCTYGQTFNVPSVPASRTGYVFTGWKVKPCFELFNDQKVQDPAIDWSSGDWYEYGSDGNSWYVRYNVINNDVNYNNGDGFQTFLYGTHVCTTESGVPQYISGYNVGNYPDDIVCLCGVKKYENDFGIATREIHCDLPTPPRWVKNYSISGTNAYNHCVQECPKDCARDFKDSSTFRNNLLGN